MTYDVELLSRRVSELMRGGRLFGEAVLEARREQRVKRAVTGWHVMTDAERERRRQGALRSWAVRKSTLAETG